MLAVERKNIIYSRLVAEGRVLVNDLALEFGVTDETIRRDLDKLEAEGLAEKIYGGALKRDNSFVEQPYIIRKSANVSAKKKIASLAAELISDGSYIALDSGTTSLEVARAISNRNCITVITNSVQILAEVATRSDWTVISTGGVLKNGSLSLVGSTAEKIVSGFHVDIAVCSCKGLSLTDGCTDSSEQEAEIKRQFFKSAKKKILAADSSKLDRVSFADVCKFNDFDVFITEKRPNDEWVEKLAQSNVELIYP